MKLRMKFLNFLILLTFSPVFSHAQKPDLKKIEKELLAASKKLFSFYQDHNQDSIDKYGDELRTKAIESLTKNPTTLTHPFRALIDSNAFEIVTSEDSLFRIYSWDTWTGGTMHYYNIIYQFRDNGKVFIEVPEWEEGDGGGFFSQIFSLRTGSKSYYLAVGNSQYSTKDHSQWIQAFTINKGKLGKDVKLIRTAKGFTNRISFEYNFFSVVDRPDRPLKLIKYDKAKKIIYIPVVNGDGTVTNKFIQYKFTGVYFEKIK